MLKKFVEYTIKSKFYLPTDRTPEKNIEIIMKGIEGLGGVPEIIGNKLVKAIPIE
jgi:hypothetical protein